MEYTGVLDKNGKACGIGLVSYVHAGNKRHKNSFYGACHFTEGIMQGPAFLMQMDTYSWHFDDLQNGITSGPCKFFNGPHTQRVIYFPDGT